MLLHTRTLVFAGGSRGAHRIQTRPHLAVWRRGGAARKFKKMKNLKISDFRIFAFESSVLFRIFGFSLSSSAFSFGFSDFRFRVQRSLSNFRIFRIFDFRVQRSLSDFRVFRIFDFRVQRSLSKWLFFSENFGNFRIFEFSRCAPKEPPKRERKTFGFSRCPPPALQTARWGLV